MFDRFFRRVDPFSTDSFYRSCRPTGGDGDHPGFGLVFVRHERKSGEKVRYPG